MRRCRLFLIFGFYLFTFSVQADGEPGTYSDRLQDEMAEADLRQPNYEFDGPEMTAFRPLQDRIQAAEENLERLSSPGFRGLKLKPVVYGMLAGFGIHTLLVANYALATHGQGMSSGHWGISSSRARSSASASARGAIRRPSGGDLVTDTSTYAARKARDCMAHRTIFKRRKCQSRSPPS